MPRVEWVFFDMDGVIADFVGGALAAHGRPVPEYRGEQWPWEIESWYGMSGNEFWRPLKNASFWADLPPLEDGMRMLAEAERLFGERVVLLSSATTEGSMDGKLAWIERHVPRYRRRYLFGAHKEAVARAGVVLVDDWERNEREFVRHGGGVVLVPRPWNRMHGEDAEAHVRTALRELSR